MRTVWSAVKGRPMTGGSGLDLWMDIDTWPEAGATATSRARDVSD
jgi:hypothetical protein